MRASRAGGERAVGRRRRRWWSYLPAVAWALLLLWLGSRPSLPLPPSALPIDKLAHFGAYGVLGALLGAGWWRNDRRPAAWIMLVLFVAVGAVDELNQTRVPGREADVVDFAADAAGVLAGFWLSAGWLRRRAGEGA